MIKRIHTVKNCVFLPLLTELKSDGVNLSRLAKKSGLGRFHLENSESYIPSDRFYQLLEEIRKLGVDDFMGKFYESLKVDNLSSFGDQIQLLPTLLDACQFGEKFNQSLVSNEALKFEINGAKTTCIINVFGKPHRSWNDLELISISQFIDAVRLYVGDNWQPLEIHLRTKKMPNLDTIFESNNFSHLKLGQAKTKVIFKTKLLEKSIVNNLDKEVNYSRFGNSIDLTNSSKILKMIESTRTIPTLAEVASFFDMSQSSVKRMLATENENFYELVDNWRMKKAIRLIEDQNYKVKDVSKNLGYANQANFNRSFKRWTKFSPKAYREQL